MAEELQNLLDRIQKDGIEKAETRTRQIVAEAERKAADVVVQAERQAGLRRERAEQDAQSYLDRSRKALEQAARDVILSVHNAVNKTMERIVAERVTQALTPDLLKQLLGKIVQAYAASDHAADSIELLVNPHDQKGIQEFFMAEFRKAMEKGLRIEANDSVIGGFQVSLAGKSVRHDFTTEAIAEALCQLLRPHLADIVRDAVKEGKG